MLLTNKMFECSRLLGETSNKESYSPPVQTEDQLAQVVTI